MKRVYTIGRDFYFKVSITVDIDGRYFLFGFILHLRIVISAKQFSATTMDVSSLDNEVFPLEEDLVNYTQQVIPALITIPPEVLLEWSRSGSDGEKYKCLQWIEIIHMHHG